MYYKVDNPEVFRANIIKKLNDIIEDEKISKNLEVGIYNYCIKRATSLKVIKKWDNQYFINIYIAHLKTIYFKIKNKELLDRLLLRNLLLFVVRRIRIFAAFWRNRHANLPNFRL